MKPETPSQAPGAGEGESPRVGVVIQHTAARAVLLPRLLDALGDGWHGDPQVVTDTEASPWATYRACLDLANAWPLAAPDAPTHLLVIQDDALPVSRLAERLGALITLRPLDVLCLYTPQQPAYMGRVVQGAFAAGRPFAQLPGGMFTPVVATSYPLATASDVLVWWESGVQPRHRRADDAQIARYLRKRKRFAQAVVPCLVDHDELTPSLLGLGRYRRHAAVMAAYA